MLIKGTVGIKTIKNFIHTALMPVGRVMYIYGGGWNEADNGGGKETMTIGLSQRWLDFCQKQDSNFNFRKYDYNIDKSIIHCGLDCSGYIGWVIYNVLNDGKDFVCTSYKAGEMLNKYGKLIKNTNITHRKPGDIMYGHNANCRHIYISLGECCDGSQLLVHASPPGVQLSGTVTPDGNENSLAEKLASKYMKKHYPDWYSRYPQNLRDISYLTDYNQFRWNTLTDPEGYRKLTPEKLLADIYK